MSRTRTPSPQPYEIGMCRVCGCTDDDGCPPPGCWWPPGGLHTICSACAELDPAAKAARRAQAIDALWQRIEDQQEAVLSLKARRDRLVELERREAS